MQLVDIAVKRPVAIAMFTLAVLLFGMVSLGRLSVNLLPELAYPTLTIRTDYTGAAPAEVEQLVSKPIEETIGTVKGVRTVKSISRPGQSDVVLEFAWGTAMDFASLEVREKLDILQLPLDVDKPRLLRFNPSLDPILRYGLSFNTPDPSVEAMKSLRIYADEQIKRQLESIEGVASVKIGGALENEIQVLVDQRRVSQLNISINTIITRLKEENLNTAGGRIDNGNQAFLVRTLNQFTGLNEIGELYIANRNGKSIRLRDVATIQNTYKERDAISRFNGKEGAEIAIYKEGDANSVDVARLVGIALERIQNQLPSDYALDKVYDQSEFIKQAIEDVKSSAIIGGILAMIILYLFLKDFWPTLIISVSIPLSVIATFNLMYGNDISLNIMSLGGIALAVGLLVDNSIVVLENIDKHKQRGKGLISAAAAATEGTKEVSSAILASTLTTLAVFVPLIFVEGIAGQLFSDQAMTVSFALIASLIVALTVIPALAAKAHREDSFTEQDALEPTPAGRPEGWRKIVFYITWPLRMLVKLVFGIIPMLVTTLLITVWRAISTALSFIFKPLTGLFGLAFNGIEKLYNVSLKAALRTRWLVLGVAVAVTASAFMLIPRLGMELIPRMSQGEFFIEVTLPAGSRVEQTDDLLTRLALYTESLPDVNRTYSLAGTGSLISAAPSQGGDHWGKLNVVLDKQASDADEARVKESLREYLAKQAGVQSKFGYPELFTFAAPIQIELQGYDLALLQRSADSLKQALEGSSRFADVTSSLRVGNPELKINFNHAALARLELDASTAAKLVAAQIGGEVATQYSMRDRKVDILVRTADTQRDQIDDISQIIINPGAEQPVPLHAVAEVFVSNGPSEITRVGQQRVALLEANLRYGDLAQGVAEAEQIIREIALPPQLRATIAGQSEDMQQSFDSLMLALALAIFMVYLVMASQFESLGHPLLILFAIPMAVAGAIYGLLLTNTNVSVVVFIGLIMLCGIVVNNAIVLIDRINQLREQGQDKHSAIIDAANSRLRPIIMTTLTTILGLLPMAIGFGEGAEVRTPMAITVIFGLLFSTLLTLILLPVIYSLFDRKQFAVTANDTAGGKVYG